MHFQIFGKKDKQKRQRKNSQHQIVSTLQKSLSGQMEFENDCMENVHPRMIYEVLNFVKRHGSIDR